MADCWDAISAPGPFGFDPLAAPVSNTFVGWKQSMFSCNLFGFIDRVAKIGQLSNIERDPPSCWPQVPMLVLEPDADIDELMPIELGQFDANALAVALRNVSDYFLHGYGPCS